MKRLVIYGYKLLHQINIGGTRKGQFPLVRVSSPSHLATDCCISSELARRYMMNIGFLLCATLINREVSMLGLFWPRQLSVVFVFKSCLDRNGTWESLKALRFWCSAILIQIFEDSRLDFTEIGLATAGDSLMGNDAVALQPQHATS